MMKKNGLVLTMSVLLAASALAGCSQKTDTEPSSETAAQVSTEVPEETADRKSVV